MWFQHWMCGGVRRLFRRSLFSSRPTARRMRSQCDKLLLWRHNRDVTVWNVVFLHSRNDWPLCHRPLQPKIDLWRSDWQMRSISTRLAAIKTFIMLCFCTHKLRLSFDVCVTYSNLSSTILLSWKKKTGQKSGNCPINGCVYIWVSLISLVIAILQPSLLCLLLTLSECRA